MKKYLIGTFAIALAIAGSAFTVASNTKQTLPIYADISGSYVQLVNAYNSTLCKNSVTIQCAYQETAAGVGNVTAPFTTTQAATFLADGWIVATDTNNGTYAGN